jgi:hypothetical protein
MIITNWTANTVVAGSFSLHVHWRYRLHLGRFFWKETLRQDGTCNKGSPCLFFSFLEDTQE